MLSNDERRAQRALERADELAARAERKEGSMKRKSWDPVRDVRATIDKLQRQRDRLRALTDDGDELGPHEHLIASSRVHVEKAIRDLSMYLLPSEKAR